MAEFTRIPTFRNIFLPEERVRRAVASPSETNGPSTSSPIKDIGSRIKKLDLYVMSNCSVNRAELLVSRCVESETEDFAESRPIMDHGLVSVYSTYLMCLPYRKRQILCEIV